MIRSIVEDFEKAHGGVKNRAVRIAANQLITTIQNENKKLALNGGNLIDVDPDTPNKWAEMTDDDFEELMEELLQDITNEEQLDSEYDRLERLRFNAQVQFPKGLVDVDVVTFNDQKVLIVGEFHIEAIQAFPLITDILDRTRVENKCVDYFLEHGVWEYDTFTARPEHVEDLALEGGGQTSLGFLRGDFENRKKEKSPYLRMHKFDTRYVKGKAKETFVNNYVGKLFVNDKDGTFKRRLISFMTNILDVREPYLFQHQRSLHDFKQQFGGGNIGAHTFIDEVKGSFEEHMVLQYLNYLVSMRHKIKKQFDNISTELQMSVSPDILIPEMYLPVIAETDLYLFYRLIRSYPGKPGNMFNETCGRTVQRGVVYGGVNHTRNIKKFFTEIGATVDGFVENHARIKSMENIPDQLFS
jgi:hypothetical protein